MTAAAAETKATTYRNPWHRPGVSQDPAIYSTAARPLIHAGHLIYQRIKGICFDVVKDGVCVGQYAGLSGAKSCAEIRDAHDITAPGFGNLPVCGWCPALPWTQGHVDGDPRLPF